MATWFTRMSSRENERVDILQGTLDLIVLQVLATMGAQHAYGIAHRVEQVAENLLSLKQGTLYPALVRLEQNGWIRGEWGKTENNRDAKYYTLSKTGQRALEKETERWRRSVGLVEKILS
jgi:PadR family transcriptional regulator PadR